MPGELVPLATAAMIGFLHALEVDHMVAVTTFVSRRPTLAAAAGFGLRWGLGHSLAVLVVGGVLLATGIRWPERYDALGEAVVGVMLVGLGVWTLVSARKLHLHTPEEHGGHAHLHLHALAGKDLRGHHHHHEHDHDRHPADRPHDHGGITLVGLLHGLAGTAGVVALVPVTLMDRVSLGFGYLSLFGVGVTVAMTVFATAAAAAMRRANRRSLVWGRRATAVIGWCGVGIGIWWVWSAAII
jgi:ABC-type nickel/cobalt efflux system permease component RcnA